MNAITKALDHIKFTVPYEVLTAAFKDDYVNWRQAPVSKDTLIYEKVIKARVLVDANLVGGNQVIIPLDGLPMQLMDAFTYLYEIPATLTNNREIVSIQSVGYMPYAGAFGFGSYNQPMAANGSMSDLATAGQRVMNSYSSIPTISTASADITGYNTVVIRDSQRITGCYTLRCTIANELNLNNINPRSHLKFAKLCELAVKAYIYNKLIIKMDQAFLAGGQELGSLKNYVDQLSDHEEMYNTYLRDVWQVTAFHNDSPNFERFIRMQISPGL